MGRREGSEENGGRNILGEMEGGEGRKEGEDGGERLGMEGNGRGRREIKGRDDSFQTDQGGKVRRVRKGKEEGRGEGLQGRKRKRSTELWKRWRRIRGWTARKGK